MKEACYLDRIFDTSKIDPVRDHLYLLGYLHSLREETTVSTKTVPERYDRDFERDVGKRDWLCATLMEIEIVIGEGLISETTLRRYDEFNRYRGETGMNFREIRKEDIVFVKKILCSVIGNLEKKLGERIVSQEKLAKVG